MQIKLLFNKWKVRERIGFKSLVIWSTCGLLFITIIGLGVP
jgi:hypothetical protein